MQGTIVRSVPILTDKIFLHMIQQRILSFFQVSKVFRNKVMSESPPIASSLDNHNDGGRTFGTTMVTRRQTGSIIIKNDTTVHKSENQQQGHSDEVLTRFIEPNTTPGWLRERLQQRHKRRVQLYHLTRGYKRIRYQRENKLIEIERQKCNQKLNDVITRSTNSHFTLSCHKCKEEHCGTRKDLVQHLKRCFVDESFIDDKKTINSNHSQEGDALPPTWMCEVCEHIIFTDYGEACMHEKSCREQRQIEDGKAEADREKANETISGKETIGGNRSSEIEQVVVPQLNSWLQLSDSILDRLSPHNSLLLQNIEFFQVSEDDIEHRVYRDEIRCGQIGLRCISCAEQGRVHGTHTRAAYCFPGSIRSIASGMATISRRHFTADKCNTINKETLHELKITKSANTSNPSNGSDGKGRYGLETLCKDIARKYSLVELSGSLFFEKDCNGIGDNGLIGTSEPKLNFSYHVPEDDLNQWRLLQDEFESNESHQYQPTAQPFFWECKACKTLPHELRASGSVLFSIPDCSKYSDVSTTDAISNTMKRHNLLCRGENKVETARTPLKQVETQNNNRDEVSSRLNGEEKRMIDTSILLPSGSLHSKELLVLESDKDLVPEYVYFMMLQLLPCILQPDAVGGSRSEMPAGYPGLACRFCCNISSGRRFFYSSPLKLWNSFGNIACHILEQCADCPYNVRLTLEHLKQQRGKTRARGSQKKFMERVWNRLHRCQNVKSKVEYGVEASGNKDEMTPQSTNNSVRMNQVNENEVDHRVQDDCSSDNKMDTNMMNDHSYVVNQIPHVGDPVGEPNAGKRADSNGFEMDNGIVLVADRPFATDFTYLSIQQMIKCKLDSSDHGRRNLFPIGFGGLECKYCAPYPTSRKFFYRTVDVLAGNFAQVPNHLLGCKFVPENIKGALLEAKKTHSAQKNKFLHGSQREFLSRVWKRIHS